MTDRHLGHLQAVAIFSRVLARSSETPEPFTPIHRVDVFLCALKCISGKSDQGVESLCAALSALLRNVISFPS
jgi:hypothetical protein